MNIYDFFNSRDIAKHCRDIDHKFTSIEMACLVWHSNHHTIAQKHAAWNYIIETTPDIALPQNYWVKISLHEFLRTVIKTQNEFVEEFISSKGSYVYVATSLSQYTRHRFVGDQVFSSYIACLDSVRNTISKKYGEYIGIARYKLHATPLSALDSDVLPDGGDALILNEQLDVLGFELAGDDFKTQNEMCYIDPSFVFDDLPIAISTPFTCGDIVKDVSNRWLSYNACSPFVVECYPLMPNKVKKSPGWERSQRSVKGWFLASNGEVFWNYGSDYLNLSYYDIGENETILSVVSQYFRREISAEELIQRYQESRASNSILQNLVQREEQQRKEHAEKG